MRMNRKSLFFLIGLLGISATIIQGQPDFKPVQNPEAFKKKLQTESLKTNSISCDFEQERNLAMLSKPIVSRGHFWYKRPASIRWEYNEPHSQLIIFNKKKIYIKQNEKEQEFDMQSGMLFKNLGDIMFSFILGDFDAAEQYYKARYLENHSTYFIELIPLVKQHKDPLHQIDMYFEKKDFSLEKIIMYESQDDFTMITFKNKVFNKTIPADMFKDKN